MTTLQRTAQLIADECDSANVGGTFDSTRAEEIISNLVKDLQSRIHKETCSWVEMLNLAQKMETERNTALAAVRGYIFAFENHQITNASNTLGDATGVVYDMCKEAIAKAKGAA